MSLTKLDKVMTASNIIGGEGRLPLKVIALLLGQQWGWDGALEGWHHM